MGRIATVLALGATLLAVHTRLAFAGGALDTVTQGASAGLGAPPTVVQGAQGGALIVAGPLESDDPAPRGEELALRVAARIAARIGAGSRAHPHTAELATARALAGRASALIYVRTALTRGALRVTIDVYPSMANAWDRIRNPLPSPAGHTTASAPIDAGIRVFLAPLVLEQATVERARHEEGDVLGAACGDADGDGDNEIVLVSAARVALGRVRAGRFVAERTAAWSALAPETPVPMREPIVVGAIASGAVAVGSTERGGFRLTPALGVDAPLAGLPVWGGEDVVCLRPEPSAGAFDGAPVECSLRGEPRPKMAVPAPRFDAFGAALVADALGNARTVLAVREPSGRLRLKAGDALGVADGTFGAQLAVGDLDQDGVPEIVTTTDAPTGPSPARPDDAIDIATWAPGSPPGGSDVRGRVHLPTPVAVRALAMCPPGDHGQPAVIAVVGGEVWTVRAGIGSPPVPTAVVPPKASR
jgi:hypothetical protein